MKIACNILSLATMVGVLNFTLNGLRAPTVERKPVGPLHYADYTLPTAARLGLRRRAAARDKVTSALQCRTLNNNDGTHVICDRKHCSVTDGVIILRSRHGSAKDASNRTMEASSVLRSLLQVEKNKRIFEKNVLQLVRASWSRNTDAINRDRDDGCPVACYSGRRDNPTASPENNANDSVPYKLPGRNPADGEKSRRRRTSNRGSKNRRRIASRLDMRPGSAVMVTTTNVPIDYSTRPSGDSNLLSEVNNVTLRKSNSDTILSEKRNASLKDELILPTVSKSGTVLRGFASNEDVKRRDSSTLPKLHINEHAFDISKRFRKKLSPLLSRRSDTASPSLGPLCLSPRERGRLTNSASPPVLSSVTAEFRAPRSRSDIKLGRSMSPIKLHRQQTQDYAVKAMKVYWSDAQTANRVEMGLHFPGAPPSTPDIVRLQGRFEYIPSMSDVKSQRTLKHRLDALKKIRREKANKLKEQSRLAEKQEQKTKLENLKKYQRQQIYALNKVMTEYEHAMFAQFCENNGITT